METSETIESIEKTVQYFDNLSGLNPASVVREKFRASVVARLEKFLDGNAKGTTKTAVKQFFNQCADDCLDTIEPSLQEAVAETKQYLVNAACMARNLNLVKYTIDDLRNQRKQLELEIEELGKHKEELAETFPDPRARAAYEIYTRVSESDKFDDSYTKQCRIRQAGLMAAAYLGLQRYEINPQTKPIKND